VPRGVRAAGLWLLTRTPEHSQSILASHVAPVRAGQVPLCMPQCGDTGACQAHMVGSLLSCKRHPHHGHRRPGTAPSPARRAQRAWPFRIVDRIRLPGAAMSALWCP